MNRLEMEQLCETYPPLLVAYWKWVDVLSGKSKFGNSRNCALCYVYLQAHCKCKDCILTQINKNFKCLKETSPYGRVSRAYMRKTNWCNDAIVFAMLLRALALKEGVSKELF